MVDNPETWAKTDGVVKSLSFLHYTHSFIKGDIGVSSISPLMEPPALFFPCLCGEVSLFNNLVTENARVLETYNTLTINKLSNRLATHNP